MKTALVSPYKDIPAGSEADAILRACVHCGLCTATCPTYGLLGDERDSPRGRIYLIKQILEGRPAGRVTRFHLDRCLTCGACETTCPSGVPYRRLLHLGREIMERKAIRPLPARLGRLALRKVLPYPKRLSPLVGLGRAMSPLLPRALAARIPPRKDLSDRPERFPERSLKSSRQRKVLLLEGCVQSVMTPETNAALIRVLDRMEIGVAHEPTAGCCGALSYHASASAEAMGFMRCNIDAWWPHVAAGIKGIVVSASGCGVMVQEYGYVLRHDPDYAAKAACVSSLVRDPVLLLAGAEERWGAIGEGRRIAFHAPCSLQHGLRLPGRVEDLLARLGFTLTEAPDAHLCCGSAGAYSLLQPGLSRQLLANKLACLEAGEPELIVTANVGCQLHLRAGAGTPVRHWIELLDG
uniref:Glycolate oxidase iron-sulfur subunit n=1 Tax=Candidatus Kentrum sp. LPFa TaxID=2126335 RepID=A0A450WAB9_9GAMM|nr:MAG: glycolate oxidase iron-sulfur subunit [Candidatus Kentron sp. LPFa]